MAFRFLSHDLFQQRFRVDEMVAGEEFGAEGFFFKQPFAFAKEKDGQNRNTRQSQAIGEID